MKYCENCGKPVNENQDFCLNCGKILKSNKIVKDNNYNPNKTHSKTNNAVIIIIIIILLIVIGICTLSIINARGWFGKESNFLNENTYAYPDSKNTIVTLSKYNLLDTGMTEQEVWDIIGGKCTNTGTTDIGAGDEFITITYGCNGKGRVGANVILIFQGGKLYSKSQAGLQ